MSVVEIGQLVGALGVGALGAAIVQGFINGRNFAAQREHETALRQLDRDHELQMSRLADARTVRDRRSQRIYSNLSTLVEVALLFGERTEVMRVRPNDYAQGQFRADLQAAFNRMLDLRSVILLDDETEPLLVKVNDAQMGYETFLSELGIWKQIRDSRERGLPEQAKVVEQSGQKVIDLMNLIIREARETLAKAEAAL